jgi:hypothetical protein
VETTLYLPVKRFLEKLGFEVKGEIRGCDVVAVKGDDRAFVVVSKLKLSFNLELVLQGFDRTAACDEVWLAVRTTARGRENDPRVRKLCRFLGFGLLGLSKRGRVEVLVDPTRWRRSQLVDEHCRRQGDPAMGGGSRGPIMTAYRQEALACAAALAAGPCSVRALKATSTDAPKILLGNVYGWFVRIERGIYALTDAGRAALVRWPTSERATRVA